MSFDLPITVNNLDVTKFYSDLNNPSSFMCKCGTLVKVRPCGDNFKNNKTYLGIFIGDMPLENSIAYNKTEKKLRIIPIKNPVIFVPELKQIVWGCHSWWSAIKNPDELKEITDDDIQNVWYVKALKEQLEKDTEEDDRV